MSPSKASNLPWDGSLVPAPSSLASGSASSHDENPWDKFADLSEDEKKLPGGVRVGKGRGKEGGTAAAAVTSWQAAGETGDRDESDSHSSDGSSGGSKSSWGVSSTDSRGYPLQFAMTFDRPAAVGREHVVHRRHSNEQVFDSELRDQPSGQQDTGMEGVDDGGAVGGGASGEAVMSEGDREVEVYSNEGHEDNDAYADYDDSDESTGSWGVQQPEQRNAAVVVSRGGSAATSASASVIASKDGGSQKAGAADGGLDELMRRFHVGAHQQRVVHPRDIPQLALTPAPAWLLEPLPWYQVSRAGVGWQVRGPQFQLPLQQPIVATLWDSTHE